MKMRSRLLVQAVAQVVSALNPYQAHHLLHAHLEPQGSTSPHQRAL